MQLAHVQTAHANPSDLLSTEVKAERKYIYATLCSQLKVTYTCQPPHLFGEGARHDEGRVTCGTAKVEQAALRQHNDAVAIGENKAVTLGLDVLVLNTVPCHQARHVNLVVKVTNIADDGIILHLCHVRGHDNVLVSSSRDEDVGCS
jgi:hypothetical protein